MNSQRWQRVRALFEQALSIPVDQRDAWLALECGDDSELRVEVESLLCSDARVADQPTAVSNAAPALLQAFDEDQRALQHSRLIGTRLGPWRIGRELGRGGMGAVYLAERDDGQFQQQAAIKLVHPGWDVGELLLRFRAERQILASLNHPNIARLLDGGISDQGKPYLVLEYIDGVAIDRYCADKGASLVERLDLFLTVCAAVTHAHRALIVHRDLKPSNILVTAEGVVKLLDFGIAKLMPGAGINTTHSALRAFTPEYAAPEQIRGDVTTTGVDVYALGLLLYLLLTGRRPYGQTASTPAAYEQAILTQEPERPSRAAGATETDGRDFNSPDPRRRAALAKELRGDLDAIVLRALRKETAQRYGSVEALADDVRRYLARQPVLARRGNWRYATARFIQRHALASALTALASLSLIVGLGSALWQAEQAQLARERAERQARVASAVAELMTRSFALADPAHANVKEPSAKHLLDQGLRSIDEQTDLDDVMRATLLTAIGRAYAGLEDRVSAQRVFQRALQMAKAQGDVALQVEIQTSLASELNKSNQYEAALTLLIQTRALFVRSALTDAALDSHLDARTAQVLSNMRRNADALAPMRRAFASQQQLFGATSAEVSELLGLYIQVLSANDLRDEAESVARKAYQDSRADPAMPLARRIAAADAFAQVLLNSGKPEQAEPLFRESLGLEQTLYGKDDLRTTAAINNLAVSLQRQQHFDGAASLFEQVVLIRKRELGATDVRIARALMAAGQARELALQYSAAIDLLREGIALWHKGTATRDERYLRGTLSLIRALEQQTDLREALRVAQSLQPYTDGEMRDYGANLAGDMRLLQARLLHRSGEPDAACAAINRLLATPNLKPRINPEGQILAAHCLQQQGKSAAAQAVIGKLDRSADALARVSAYSRRLLSELTPEAD